jgi:thioredoxin reductase
MPDPNQDLIDYAGKMPDSPAASPSPGKSPDPYQDLIDFADKQGGNGQTTAASSPMPETDRAVSNASSLFRAPLSQSQYMAAHGMRTPAAAQTITNNLIQGALNLVKPVGSAFETVFGGGLRESPENVVPTSPFRNPFMREGETYAQRMARHQANMREDPLLAATQRMPEWSARNFPIPTGYENTKYGNLAGAAGSFGDILLSGPLAPVTIGMQTLGETLDKTYSENKNKGMSDEDAARDAYQKAYAGGATAAAIWAVLPRALKPVIDKVIDKIGVEGFKRWLVGRGAQAVEGAGLGVGTQIPVNIATGRPALENVGPTAASLAAAQLLFPRGHTAGEVRTFQANELAAKQAADAFIRNRPLPGPPTPGVGTRFGPEAEAEGAVGEPVTQEVTTDAIKSSDAQVQRGEATQRQQPRPDGTIPKPGDSDYVVGKAERETAGREIPPESKPATEAVAPETPATHEPKVIPRGTDTAQEVAKGTAAELQKEKERFQVKKNADEKFDVIDTAIPGSGVISTHDNESTAEEAAAKYKAQAPPSLGEGTYPAKILEQSQLENPQIRELVARTADLRNQASEVLRRSRKIPMGETRQARQQRADIAKEHDAVLTELWNTWDKIHQIRSESGKPREFVIIGGGASGLKAALQAAYENVDVLVLEKEASTGGQAKHSMEIVNTGATGEGTTGRDYFRARDLRARNRGAEIRTGSEVANLRPRADGGVDIITRNGEVIPALRVAIMTGSKIVKFKGMDLAGWGNGERFATLTHGKVGLSNGSGNSATQAIVGAIREGTKKVIAVSRSKFGPETSGDQYDRLMDYVAKGKVELVHGEIKGITKDPDTGGVKVRVALNKEVTDPETGQKSNKPTGEIKTFDAAHAENFLATAINTGWIPEGIAKRPTFDRHGKPVPGPVIPMDASLKTTMPGVFAGGDIREALPGEKKPRRIDKAEGDATDIAASVLADVVKYRNTGKLPPWETTKQEMGADEELKILKGVPRPPETLETDIPETTTSTPSTGGQTIPSQTKNAPTSRPTSKTSEEKTKPLFEEAPKAPSKVPVERKTRIAHAALTPPQQQQQQDQKRKGGVTLGPVIKGSVAAPGKLGPLADKYTQTGQTEAVIAKDLFDRTNPDREANIAQEFNLNTVTPHMADVAARQVYDFSQKNLRDVRKLPDTVTVYRAGAISDDVVGVTLDRQVAQRNSDRHGDPVEEYTVPRKQILADLEALRPEGFQESELLVHPEHLKRTATEPTIAERQMSDQQAETLANARMAENPLHADELITDLSSGKRSSVDGADEKVLLKQKRQWMEARDRAARRALNESLNKDERVNAASSYHNLDNHLQQMEAATDDGNVFRTKPNNLQWHQFKQKDYEMPAMEQKLQMAKGGAPLTPEETAGLKKQTDRLSSAMADVEARKRMTGWRPGLGSKVDPTLRDAQFEAHKAKEALDDTIWKANMKSQGLLKRTGRTAREISAIPRAIMASMDLSAVRRQGGLFFMSHPLRSIAAMPDMIRAARSEKEYFKLMQDIRERPNANLYVSSKLGLTDVKSPKLSTLEEMYMSRWADHIPLVSHSQRAYVYFLNRLRADTFDAMAATLGRNGHVTDAQAEGLSNFINVFTGRGDVGKHGQALALLNELFFAPRYTLSRFQVLTGQPFFHAKDPAVKKLIAAEYAKTLIGYGIMYGLASTVGEAMGVKVEYNPQSSDFGKIRVGNTRIDPLSGLSQVTVVIARTLPEMKLFGVRLPTGRTKTAQGQLVPLGGQRQPFSQRNIGNVIYDFGRSKLAPMPSAFLNARSGKKVTGEPTTLKKELAGLVTPMSGNDIIQAIMEHGFAKGMALGAIAFFGDSVNTYSTRVKVRQRKQHRSRSGGG